MCFTSRRDVYEMQVNLQSAEAELQRSVSCFIDQFFYIDLFLYFIFSCCENNWVRKIARVTRADRGRDGNAEELNRETGEEQITVGWTRRKDGG